MHERTTATSDPVFNFGCQRKNWFDLYRHKSKSCDEKQICCYCSDKRRYKQDISSDDDIYFHQRKSKTMSHTTCRRSIKLHHNLRTCITSKQDIISYTTLQDSISYHLSSGIQDCNLRRNFSLFGTRLMFLECISSTSTITYIISVLVT